MDKLTISSFNSHGLGEDRIRSIQNLCINNTFTLIQEHWLLGNQLDKLADTRVNHTGVLAVGTYLGFSWQLESLHSLSIHYMDLIM